jgi:hypothetical protein
VEIVVPHRLLQQTDTLLVIQWHNVHIDEIIWSLMETTGVRYADMQIFPYILLNISVELLLSVIIKHFGEKIPSIAFGVILTLF